MFNTLMHLLFAVTILFSFRPCPSDGARILLVVDSMNSHVMLHSRLGLQLAKLGHQVRVLAPANARVPDFVRQYHKRQPMPTGDANDSTFIGGGSFNYTTFQVDGELPYPNSQEFSDLAVQAAVTRSMVERVQLVYTATRDFMRQGHRDCMSLIGNRLIMDELKNSHFEFVIADPSAYMFVVPLFLRVPYATMSVTMISTSYRIPRLPSSTPHMPFDYTDRMTFRQRLFNLIFELAITLLQQRWTISVPDAWHNSAGEETPRQSEIPVADSFLQSSLWLLVEDISVGYPMPLMPNTIPVGDIMTGEPGHQLPADMESFVASSSNGVILMSFGSYLDNLPDNIIEKFCDSFRRLSNGIGVVWKLKKTVSCSDLPSVKTSSWIPQNDLLADKRVRLLISHGGLNSLMETVYHAKPVIVFPVLGDQPVNAQATVSKGYAIRMDIGDFTADSLLANIEEMLADRKYEQNAQRWSSILRDRKDSPAERVSHAINHVIKYGDSQLQTGAFRLNIIQYLMMDLFAVFYLLVVAEFMICGFIVRYFYRKYLRRTCAGAKRHGKTKSE